MKRKDSLGWSFLHHVPPPAWNGLGTESKGQDTQLSVPLQPQPVPERWGVEGTAAAPTVLRGAAAFAGHVGRGRSQALQMGPPALGTPPPHTHLGGRHSGCFQRGCCSRGLLPAVLGGPATSPGQAEA